MISGSTPAPYVAALEYATGTRAKLFGKPAPDFFSQVVAGLEVPAHRVLMIGDDAVSDVAGAQDAGLAGALVQTGKFSPKTSNGQASVQT